MGRDFFPRRGADIVGWSRSFNQQINAAPETYGLTAAQAADYAAAHDAYVGAYQRATDPNTATPAAKVAKRDAMKVLENQARELGRIIRGAPQVTTTMRVELGLCPRNGGGKSPAVHAPASMPVVDVMMVQGHTIHIRLRDPESPRRGKPPGVAWAAIHYYVGETAPTVVSDWQIGGYTSETTADVQLDPQLPPGAKVWITAYWFNRRAESGPGAAPVYAHIGFGGMRLAA
jgi:hypothetical protein